MAKIVAIGASLQDLYLLDRDDFRVTKAGGEELYRGLVVGTKVDIDRMYQTIGGGGVNAAVELARHGHKVTFFGNVARDAAGAAVIQELSREGVDTSHVRYLEHKNTGVSVVLLSTESGERTILTYRGASEQFGNFSVAEIRHLAPEWVYVTTLRGDFASFERILKAARAVGAKVVFNPGSKELEQLEKLRELLPQVAVVNINRSEAEKLVGEKTTDITRLLSKIHESVPTVIITDGSQGGVATNGEEAYRFGVYEDCPIVDATGAGDAFGSGFLAHLAAGHSFAESLIFASANSTAVVQKIGGHTGALTGAERLHPMQLTKI